MVLLQIFICFMQQSQKYFQISFIIMGKYICKVILEYWLVSIFPE